MEPLAALSLIATVLSPLLTAILTRPSMSANAKRIIAAVVAGTLGLILVIVSGQIPELPQILIDGVTRTLVIVALVIGGAQAVYPLLKGVTDKIEANVGVKDDPAATVHPEDGE